MNPIATAAKYYTDHGWRVFPVNEGKLPKNKNGVIRANLNPYQFEIGDRIAIATGALSELCVVDLDVKDGANGIEEFKKLTNGHPEIITRVIKTPSGGLHLYFKYHGPFINSRIDHPSVGIDFKADGLDGYVVAPSSVIDPSFLDNGGSYSVVNDIEPAELPDWLIEIMTEPIKGITAGPLWLWELMIAYGETGSNKQS